MLTYPVVAKGDNIYTQVPGWDLIRETSRGGTLCRRAWEQVPGWGLPLCGDGFGAGNEVASTAIVAGLKAARRKLAPSLLWSRANRPANMPLGDGALRRGGGTGPAPEPGPVTTRAASAAPAVSTGPETVRPFPLLVRLPRRRGPPPPESSSSCGRPPRWN